MSKENPTIDDPRLTAYILGELEESEQSQFEAELARNPQLQAALNDLRQAASQVSAALQSEPGIALTDEQLDQIRTAAYAPAPRPAQPDPARVAVIGRPAPASSPAVASSAIVLAGLVLATVAMVLSAHFPERRLVDESGFSPSELALLDDHTNWGIATDSLPGEAVAASTTFADHTVARTGPSLVYDELRRAYRLDVPVNGIIEGHYVAFVSAGDRDESRPEDATIEESLEVQELAETAAGDHLNFMMFDLPEAGADPAFDTTRSLGVVDTNGNGRFDDDALWFNTGGQPLFTTESRSRGAYPVLELEAEPPTAGAGPTTTAAPEPTGVPDSTSDPSSDPYYFLVPLQPLLAQQDSLAAGRPLTRNLAISSDGVEMERMHFFEDQSATLGGVLDMPAPLPETAPAAPGAQPSEEALRRLGESQSGQDGEAGAARFSREYYRENSTGEGEPDRRGGYPRDAMSRARGGDNRAGESGQQDSAAPLADTNYTLEQVRAAEQNAQDRTDAITTGTVSELYRQPQAAGELLPAEHREPLGEALQQYEAAMEGRDATIQQWQDDYRILEAERQELGWAYYWNSNWEDGHWQRFGRGGGHWGAVPGTESYAPIIENDFRPTLAEPVSTFSIDVDTGSYANCRRFINSGMWPPADAVRVEELVNAFTYDDPPPEGEHPIAVNFDVAACPWQPEHRLVRIGVRAADIIRTERPPTRLVFLIDVSGSMKDANKLPLVQQSLRLLVEELGENDRVAIVTYASEAALRLEPTSGADRETILAAVDALGANGSTNGEGGLRLAYQVAERQHEVEASNRVILCTDGDFNVGESNDSELVKLIEEKRESGVFLSVFGFGTGNLEDAKLEQIADHGNGHYGYVDSLDEARQVFIHDLTGTLYTVAKDVKLQVDFNPTQVASYRLIGYENRALENADFDNDTVDAGDVGAGHSVTALYQIAPRAHSEDADPIDLTQAALDRFVRLSENVENNVRLTSDGTVLNINGTVVSEERRQQTAEHVTALLKRPEFEGVDVRNNLTVLAADELPPAGDDLLRLRVRYKHPRDDESRLWETVLVDDGTMQSSSADFQWASAVASYGLLLRQSRFRGDVTFDAIIETAQAAVGEDPTGRRQEFIDLVRQSRALYAQQTGRTSPEPVELTSVEARERATCGGKYSKLLDKLEVPEDIENYGEFRDYGYWEGDSYRTYTGLPRGYWVYVYPHWYIWGESE